MAKLAVEISKPPFIWAESTMETEQFENLFKVNNEDTKKTANAGWVSSKCSVLKYKLLNGSQLLLFIGKIY